MDRQLEHSKSVKISIITPFYNIENYVAQCLNSILTQDMPDFEIIAVNDGSTDRTPHLLEEYAAQDARIKVLHLENGGAGWARNHGVSRAIGKYILFVDGDDFILPNTLSSLYNYAEINTADVVIFCCTHWIDGTWGHTSNYPYPEDKLMDALAATKIMLLYGDGTVWNKLIRRELYVENKIVFDGETGAEDTPVSCKMLIGAKRIFYLKHSFYAYVYRSVSTVNSPRKADYIKNIIYNLNIMGEEVKNSKWKNELADVFDYRFIGVLIGLLQRCYSNPEKYKSTEELKEAKRFLQEEFSKISLSRIFSNHYLKYSYKLKALRLKTGLYKYEKTLIRLFKNNK